MEINTVRFPMPIYVNFGFRQAARQGIIDRKTQEVHQLHTHLASSPYTKVVGGRSARLGNQRSQPLA